MNPNCITNSNEPVKSFFKIETRDPVSLRCKYCDRIIEYNDMVKQF
jgi:aspartate carbamoyltransferase regulatory subunit